MNGTILIVDDAEENLEIIEALLEDDYTILKAKSGYHAIDIAKEYRPDLILLDVMMPNMDGYQTCRRLKDDPSTWDIAVVFLTSLHDGDNEEIGLKLGAIDYLHKPFRPAIFLQRIANHIRMLRNQHTLEQQVRERTAELEQTRFEIIRRLGQAAEYRDNETGMHVLRMSHSSAIMARLAGFNEARAELLRQAAPMHDVGKIGIPDQILLKPGKLDSQEWEIMRSHSLMGAQIIGDNDSPLLQLARTIALHHHERWDGNGYPFGLRGESILLEVRIVTVADVFDALISRRPYKEPWSKERAVEFILDQSGSQFDPDVVALFEQALPDIERVNSRYADEVS
ncbi:response regulator [Ectothiorhodospiraceae bacterium BW-2]|nr:response regulator [Ectothiorhodospiraceae bacterium BW-2]